MSDSTPRGLVISLSDEKPAPLRFEGLDADGNPFTFRVTFRKRLNREQAITMTRSVGKGKNRRDVPDLDRMYRTCVETVGPVDIGDGEGFRVVDDPNLVAAVIKNSPSEIADAIESHILNYTELGELEKKD